MLNTYINMGVRSNEDDKLKKKVTIAKSATGKYKISMERIRKVLNDISLISISKMKDCTGTMNINFNNLSEKLWDKSRMDILSGDTRFNNETVLIALMLFIGKCFGLEKIILDTSKRTYECDQSIMYSHFHIYYLAERGMGKFRELTFGIEKEKSYKNIVEPLMDMTIFDFSINFSRKIKITNEIRDLKLSQFCKNFIEMKECPDKDMLILASEISDHIDAFTKLRVSSPVGSVEFSQLLEYIDRE